MIKKIRSSLTVKICLLISLLLVAASGITYGVIAGFLPVYYSSRLEKNLDAASREIADTISSHERIEDTFSAIGLFEAGFQVSVVILDDEGNMVWPEVSTAVAEEITSTEDDTVEIYQYFLGNTGSGEFTDTVTKEKTEEETKEPLPADIVQEEADAPEEAVKGTAEKTSSAPEDILTENDTIVEVAEPGDAGTAVEMAGDVLYVSNLANAAAANSAVQHFDLEVGDVHYTMIVSGGMQPVNQAMEILYQIFPYILGVSVMIAVLFSLLSSLYLTRPIVGLSRTSRKMAALDFDDRYEGNRTDEIGLLGKNLNELSSNLSAALGELQQANESLKSDIEKEREAEKKRIEFFSAVSHELKTPITILKGHLSGMLQGVGEYRNQRYYLKRSEETVEKMESMVQELLTVSRIENQGFEVQKTDIAEQLRQQLADMTELMEEKELELVVDMPDHLAAEVNAAMMEKVFRNLLINAVRYTPGGEKNQIRVSLEKAADDRRICCRIENTGVSIPEAALPHLFEAFYRVEQSRSRQTGGSGLGLYIVKMILEQHGAEYGIENTSEGVYFCFKL